jgi:hypothetical protein
MSHAIALLAEGAQIQECLILSQDASYQPFEHLKQQFNQSICRMLIHAQPGAQLKYK